MFPGPLLTFYETVRCGSVRKASEILGLAPSSVSRQISLLEKQMGAALFERSANGVTLTFAGKEVAEYARVVLLDFASLKADIDETNEVKRGLIRVTTVEGSVSQNVVAAVAAFRKHYEHVSFQVRILPAPKVIDAVKMGEADVGLTFCGKPDAEISFESRTHDPISLIMPPDHPLAAERSIGIGQLKHLPLALPEPSFNIRQIVDQASLKMGFTLQPVLSSDSFSAIRSFVIAGAGLGVLTRLSARTEEKYGILKSVRVDMPAFGRTTVDVITLKKRRINKALRLFLDSLDEVMKAAGVEADAEG